jgi:hypothetical protein
VRQSIDRVVPRPAARTGHGRSRPDVVTLKVMASGHAVPLAAEVLTVGRGPGVDVDLADPTVSPLHAEIVRRGPHVYVADLGLSRTGTRVNGRPVARRLLVEGDVISFGDAQVRVTGLPDGRGDDAAVPLRRGRVVPDLTPRELDVVTTLCRPARTTQAFVAPETVTAIARELVVTEAAVKQHLMKLYAKFRIPEGPDRRTRLANAVLECGVVRAGRRDSAAASAVPGTVADLQEPSALR